MKERMKLSFSVTREVPDGTIAVIEDILKAAKGKDASYARNVCIYILGVECPAMSLAEKIAAVDMLASDLPDIEE